MSSQGLSLSLQNLLLCVQTVGVTMWFSWPCLGKSLIESRTRKTNHQTPPGSLALPVTLITTVTIPAGLMAPHLRHPYLMAVAAGASVQVSIGETRWRYIGGDGHEEEGAVASRSQADGLLIAHSSWTLWSSLCGPPPPALPGC